MGSREKTASPSSRFPEMRFPGRVLKEAGGVRSSASGLPATMVTCRKEKNRGDEEENERELTFRHTRRGLRVSSPSSSLAALDALVPPGSYSGKRGIDPAAHKLPTRVGLNQMTPSSPETLSL